MHENMARTRLLAALSIGIGVLVPLLVAELALRLLPVRTGLETLPVNDGNPVKRFAPNREFTFSDGWDFKLVNQGRSNNFGFINDQDYDSSAHTPLLAVVGDSYVEALMVPFPETLQGRLSRCVASKGRVYSFGVSGAPLSQYLAEANFARTRFRPDGLVVVVVGNDFDDSLDDFNSTPGNHYFRQQGDSLVLHRLDYTPGAGRRLIRQSAFVRYITLNLTGGVAKMGRLLKGEAPSINPGRHVGNTSASSDPERLAKSRMAVEEFLRSLPAYSGVEPPHILLVVDAIRPEMYSAEGLKAAAGSFFERMRQFLIGTAAQRGYEVVDMQPRFIQSYADDGSRLEYPSDAHWNSHGHQEAAQAVASSRVFRRIFPASCTSLLGEGQRASHP